MMFLKGVENVQRGKNRATIKWTINEESVFAGGRIQKTHDNNFRPSPESGKHGIIRGKLTEEHAVGGGEDLKVRNGGARLFEALSEVSERRVGLILI